MQIDARSILVVNATPFGKALLMLPAMQALRQAFPQTFIQAATAKGLSDLLKVFQLSDATIDLGIIKTGEQDYGSALKRLLRLLRSTNGEGFDFVVDFALFRLTENPMTASPPINVFFNGWSRTSNPIAGGAGIHHPAGDIKKFSQSTGAAVTATYGGATCWQTGTWTDGVVFVLSHPE